MRRFAPILLLALLAPLLPAAGAAPTSCGAGVPAHELTGTFGPDLQGAYVLVPFEVDEGTTRVEVRLCYDQPPSPTASTPGFSIRNTLDLGIYEPLHSHNEVWGVDEFRGWGGSSRLTAYVSPSGATNGFLPGDIPPGEWAAEIGIAAVTDLLDGNPSGVVSWRLEVHLSDDPAHAEDPWEPTPYDTEPVSAEPGWYKGDFHVHAEHSGSAPMAATFHYAFEEAGLDFLTLSDYNTPRHWDEIGRFQEQYAEHLVIRSAEIITYRGHVNNHASLTHVDHRAGPLYVWPDLDDPVRDAVAPHEMFDVIHGSDRGWTQVNHPTTFPSTVPPFANLCRGCSWEYSDAETDWSKVDAMEVQTGPSGWAGHEPATHQQVLPLEGLEPGPNPFTPLAVEWWDRLRREGHRITAVGSSDSHRAGDQSLLYSPIGHPTTVVYAEELSEQGIGDGIRAGHAYIKFFSPDGPDLRLAAPEHDAIMGDEIEADLVTLRAEVLGGLPTLDSPIPRKLVVIRDGLPYLTVPVTSDELVLEFPAARTGDHTDYRLQLMRGTAFEALSNPITLRAAD